MGQLWVTNSLGGYMSAKNLSKKLRHAVQPMIKFRAFADVKDSSHQGKKKGDVFHWDVYNNVATQGGTLVETTTMPETNFTIDQGTLTVTEYGNSVPYTGKLDALSEHPVTQIIRKVIRHDTAKALDTAAHAQFDTCLLKVEASGGTASDAVTISTSGTATGTNSIAFNKTHARLIATQMKERNLPPYTGDDYVALGWPSTFDTLLGDLEDVHKYTESGFKMILRGEIGRYHNLRFVEQTNIAKESWSNAKSDSIYFISEDGVAEGVTVAEEVRGKIPGDYGRSKGIAWYYLGGFAKCHLNATQERILHWDSLA